jgi:hypothetical protein
MLDDLAIRMFGNADVGRWGWVGSGERAVVNKTCRACFMKPWGTRERQQGVLAEMKAPLLCLAYR